MSDGRDVLPAKVNVELGASARLEVKAQVPPDSTGRLVDALTDAIRPFTEARGLRADQIRLQREEVLIKIARLAAERRGLEREAEFEPVPTKVLVPLLEKASLEDGDDEEMVARWAELLLSASRAGSIPPRFISILAELTAPQANLLQDIYFGRSQLQAPQLEESKSVLSRPFDGITVHVDINDLEKLAAACAVQSETPFDALFASLPMALRGPGLVMMGMQMSTAVADPERSIPIVRAKERDVGLDLEVLGSLNLMEKKRFDTRLKGYEIVVSFFQLTDLGLSFLIRCSTEVRAAEKQREDKLRAASGRVTRES